MVMLKGSGFMDILPQLIKTFVYAVIMNGLAVWSYKKAN
jgi:ABC-2 type transport system permease protein